jgi:hypothetical protein
MALTQCRKYPSHPPGPRAAISAQTRLPPDATRRIGHGMPRGAPKDALAALKSMSEEELIALFT